MRFVFMDNVHGDDYFGFSREQLAWLDGVLSAPAPARKFFFAHVPPRAPFRKIRPGPASLFTPRLENEAEFLDILARRHVVMAAFGHRHVHASRVHNGVLMVITGGGGQRNFLEPAVNEPRFTKKRHYTLVDIPASGPANRSRGSCPAWVWGTKHSPRHRSSRRTCSPAETSPWRSGPMPLRPPVRSVRGSRHRSVSAHRAARPEPSTVPRGPCPRDRPSS